jgi:hypothetical protein
MYSIYISIFFKKISPHLVIIIIIVVVIILMINPYKSDRIHINYYFGILNRLNYYYNSISKYKKNSVWEYIFTLSLIILLLLLLLTDLIYLFLF